MCVDLCFVFGGLFMVVNSCDWFLCKIWNHWNT